jgi:DNA-directed RNA polymerase subunit beta
MASQERALSLPVSRLTPSQVRSMETVTYGRYQSVAEIPDLVEMQTQAYEAFLQPDVLPNKRKNQGLEALLREIFPIQSYDKTLSLEYIHYELGRPSYTPEECRKLRKTFGYPFKIRVRLVKPEPVEEEIYLGEIPIMIGGGEFIINGSERVTVSQLHRSPGVDFSVEVHTGEKKLHSCWIIPERGSWIELNVTKKETVAVRIDQSGKFSAATLLRALDPNLSSDASIIREFYEVTKVKRKKSDPEAKYASQLVAAYAVGDILDEASGEPFVRSGEEITRKPPRRSPRPA